MLTFAKEFTIDKNSRQVLKSGNMNWNFLQIIWNLDNNRASLRQTKQ
jgi:hypothetical protein